MEADSLSASCPQNVFPGHELSVAIKRESLTLSIRNKFSSMSQLIIWTENRQKKLLFW